MVCFVSSFFEKIQSGMAIGAGIAIAAIVILFGTVWASQYVINYRLMRLCGLELFRALSVTLRYTYVFRFERSNYGLTIDSLLKRDLTGELIIPEGVAAIDNNAFCKCKSDSVRFPESLRYIGVNAFGDCAFTVLTIPKNVEYIDERAFQRCSKLKNAEMPFVEEFSISAFTGCEELRTIIIGGQERKLSDYGGSGLSFLLYYISAMDAAAEGSEAALSCVKIHCAKMLYLFVSQGSITNTEGLLALPFVIPAETIDNAIDAAIKNERREIYVMLVQYKREKLGYDSLGDIEERFTL